MRGKVCPGVERADAEHHRIESAQPLGIEVCAGERRDLIAHLLQAPGHAVARAGHVADPAAADRQLQADRLQARGRLEQNRGNVVVTDFDASGAEMRAANLHAGGEARRRGPGWRGDGERVSGVFPDGR